MDGRDRQRTKVAGGTAPRLYRQVFDILAGQIAQKTLPPGTRLSESSVAEQFGISRAPARQALSELERDGFLEKSAGRGYSVPAVVPDGIAAGVSPGASVIEPGEDMRLTQLSTWERIYGEVESEIAARSSFAAWRVNETDLARYYDVSRTVARDVLGRLQQRGVVRKDERSRWVAPAMTPDHVGELYELRWLLEPVALEKAFPHLPDGFLPKMRLHLEEGIAKGEDLSGPDLDRLEQELHVTLLGFSGNRTLLQAISLPQALLVAHSFLYRWMPRLFGPEPFLPEHLEVVERLQAGRVADAADALSRHLKVSRERAIDRIVQVTQEEQPDDLPYLEKLD